MERNQIIQGDVLEVLKTLPSESIDCCITSPPYWGLRDYGIDGQLGLERTPEEYVANMVEVFREVKRVLKKEGTLWLNLGDSYFGSNCGYGDYRKNKSSISIPTIYSSTSKPQAKQGKPKNLCGIPWRVAFALQADGWWLRQDIIWSKPNPMPESVADRCTKSHEYVFLLTKSSKYYFDNEAIKEPTITNDNSNRDRDNSKLNNTPGQAKMAGLKTNNYETRNRRSVWTISTQPYKEAHFATFPEKLIEPMILAGTSKKGVCPECGKAWVKVVEKTWTKQEQSPKTKAQDIEGNPMYRDGHHNDGLPHKGASKILYWQPTCKCGKDPISAVVLDPFIGSGTVAVVAKKLGRDYLGIELNEKYIEMANKRIANTLVNLEEM